MDIVRTLTEDQSGLRRTFRKGETEKIGSLGRHKCGVRGKRHSKQGVESKQGMVKEMLSGNRTHGKLINTGKGHENCEALPSR